MKVSQRIQAIRKILSKNQLSTHQEVLDHLDKINVQTNQAAISRDFNRLGVRKHDGYYVLPNESENVSSQSMLSAVCAGDNLVVIRTKPGFAMAVGMQIDELKEPSIIGTVAGDDTLFCAVSDKTSQQKVVELILNKVV